MGDKAKVFLIEDDELILSAVTRSLRSEGYDVQVESGAFRNILRRLESWGPDVVLLDVKLPDRSGIDILQEIKGSGLETEVIMLTADDTAETAVRCMKLGAADYLTKPFNVDEVKIVLSTIVKRGKINREVNYLRKVYSELFEKEIIGQSEAINILKGRIEKIAKARVPSILITGESGTGKELAARYVHRIMSGTVSGETIPFMAINCTALPETLLESELFGYEKGTFTDAKTGKKGFFELANKGTILLDEISDMKPDLQAKLLRVLEERTIRHLGGSEEIPINVTVIAISNKDLDEEVKKGNFRKDLLYRLNTFSLNIPPLRERMEDIPVLAAYFLAHFTEKYNNRTLKKISPEAEKIFVGYTWPGNIREMKNVIERIVVLESGDTIFPEHLPMEVISPGKAYGNGGGGKGIVLPDEGISLDEIEKDLIRQALVRTKGNKALAAKLLNISYDTIRYQVKKFGLE